LNKWASHTNRGTELPYEYTINCLAAYQRRGEEPQIPIRSAVGRTLASKNRKKPNKLRFKKAARIDASRLSSKNKNNFFLAISANAADKKTNINTPEVKRQRSRAK